jgi:hypothetical protein
MRVFGIDLGTTNSVAAIDGVALQHASGTQTSTVLPSIVAFPPSGAVLVGATAKKRRAIDPKNTLQVERAKIRLGRVTSVRIELSQVDPAAHAAAGGATLARDKLAELAMPRCDFDPMEVVAIGASLFRSEAA